YKLASDAAPELATADMKIDSNDACLWHFRLQRLEAEPIWDSKLSAAGTLNMEVGGPSFDLGSTGKKGTRRRRNAAGVTFSMTRRAAYITRGFSTSRDVLGSFLQAFD